MHAWVIVRNSIYSYNLAATIHLAEVTTLSHYSPATTLLCLACSCPISNASFLRYDLTCTNLYFSTCKAKAAASDPKFGQFLLKYDFIMLQLQSTLYVYRVRCVQRGCLIGCVCWTLECMCMCDKGTESIAWIWQTCLKSQSM